MSEGGLRVSGLAVRYGHVPVVHGIDLRVRPGQVVVMLGPNGAGKTTTLQAVAGAIPAFAGEVSLDGTQLRGPLHGRTRRGLAYLPEGRTVLRSLSTADNLRLGRGGVAAALAIAPELERLLGRRAGLLSGGEQQLLCLARLLATRPRLLLADELSLGLAPIIVSRMLQAARRAADEGAAVLLVEQHAHQALAVADRAVLVHRGRVVLDDSAENVLRNIDSVEEIYLAGAVMTA